MVLVLNFFFFFGLLSFFTSPPHICMYICLYLHISTWDFHDIAKWKAPIMPVVENFFIFKIVNDVVSPFRIGLSSH